MRKGLKRPKKTEPIGEKVSTMLLDMGLQVLSWIDREDGLILTLPLVLKNLM
jgi:hypothetical protein